MTAKKAKEPGVGAKTLMLKHMPPGLMAAFKAWCALRGINMRDKILSLMRETVKDTRLPGTGERG